MLFAEEAAQASSFSGFDPFVIIFTILIAIGLVRLFAAKRKNVFAIAFALVSLAVFLFMDVVMIKGW
ncbi:MULTISPECIES: DUF2759 family protein [Paenibacillus]|uniref:DUF2759 family protein n=1 Tax=Paenibacillus TaxID=44249 RepID=UPI00089FE120|nr:MULTISPECIES: DUF2759 family protein [Paenibacillus]GKS14806.1 hypothetical protein YDYSY3_58060 [Paenibacillus chitinolyticus]SEG61457.1 hypothetical protein SAMN02799616_03791 [Paenibacillus sp. UNC499MF]